MVNQSNLLNNKFKNDRVALLKQYELICQSAESITERRQNTNKFYLTINSILIGSVGYGVSLDLIIYPLLISLVGLAISSVWIRNINSFKLLNSAKFKIIHELETYLPINVYKQEDEYLKKGYYKLTSLEKMVPKVFFITYGLVLIISSCYFLINFIF